MTTFTWSFDSLDRRVNDAESGQTDVVIISHWRLIARDGEYSARVYGAASLAAPDPDNFTPYADVTKEQVKAWTLASLATTKTNENQASNPDAAEVTPDQMEKAMEDLLDNQIAIQKNPPVIPGVPSAWSS